MKRISVGKSFGSFGTDKSFNLTEYYALKSVKLSDSYMVKFGLYKSTKGTDSFDESLGDTGHKIFYCENVKIPSIKNVIHKMDAGSVGNRFAAFEHKPFDDISMTLIEDDNSSVYKFIMSRITKEYLPYRHVYYYNEGEYDKMDCVISVYDNALNKIKMEVYLKECKITSYNTSTFNSNDTSTPYMYTINFTFNAIRYDFM